MDFTLSKYPHFNSTYLEKVRFSLDLAVYDQKQKVSIFRKIMIL